MAASYPMLGASGLTVQASSRPNVVSQEILHRQTKVLGGKFMSEKVRRWPCNDSTR